MQKFIKEYGTYIILILLVILVRSFIVTPVRVNGTSMDKTLKEGEILLLYKIAKIERNDIVVVDENVQGSKIIKRVIGMPGETIKCEDGIIYIDDQKYKDKYAYGDTSDFDEVKLKKDEYFVLGDNRLVSEDSRYFGPVKEKYIEGETSVVIFPFNKIGTV